MSPATVAVTLSSALLDRLRAESGRLDIPLEWLVASLIADSMDPDAPPRGGAGR